MHVRDDRGARPIACRRAATRTIPRFHVYFHSKECPFQQNSPLFFSNRRPGTFIWAGFPRTGRRARVASNIQATISPHNLHTLTPRASINCGGCDVNIAAPKVLYECPSSLRSSFTLPARKMPGHHRSPKAPVVPALGHHAVVVHSHSHLPLNQDHHGVALMAETS
ncbi:hypothetical protein BC826DRAFT_360072 [Russula brevipes]|nr:hypothetical protein BC826DRAFT_360072 [Russula brevipes]